MNDGIYGLPHSPREAKVVIIPVPWEPTTSYRKGTAKGPNAILEASRQVDLFDVQTGRPYEQGIAMLDPDPSIARWNEEACAAAEPVIEAGGDVSKDEALADKLARVNALSVMLDDRVHAIASSLLAENKLVGVVGGDHASPLGSIRAHAERWPGLGVLHLDAHADLRVAYEGFERSHASIMNNVTKLAGVASIVQVGIRDLSEDEHRMITSSSGRIRTLFDAEIAARRFDGESFSSIASRAIDALPEHVYLSWDIDGLDPALCPSTGTPVPGGLSFHEAVHLLALVRKSGRTIVGFDLCEVAPSASGDEWDGNVGARLLYKMIGFALSPR